MIHVIVPSVVVGCNCAYQNLKKLAVIIMVHAGLFPVSFSFHSDCMSPMLNFRKQGRVLQTDIENNLSPTKENK